MKVKKIERSLHFYEVWKGKLLLGRDRGEVCFHQENLVDVRLGPA